MTRGHGRGELTLVTGRPFSGKTQVVLNALHNNSDKYAIIFTPDESAELVLSKLIAIRYGLPAADLEARVKDGDREAIRIVHDAAAHDYSRLLIVDAGLTLEQMGHALDEAQHYWGHQADVAVYDYLELLPGESSFSGVTAKAQALKAWTKQADVPMLCMHQGKKGDSDTRGQAQGMDGMRYGGEAEAIIVLEVYRKIQSKKLSDIEKVGHAYSVTIFVAKNKRPPSQTGEADYFMNPETGFIRPLTPEDRYRAGEPTRDPRVVLGTRKEDRS